MSRVERNRGVEQAGQLLRQIVDPAQIVVRTPDRVQVPRQSGNVFEHGEAVIGPPGREAAVQSSGATVHEVLAQGKCVDVNREHVWGYLQTGIGPRTQ